MITFMLGVLSSVIFWVAFFAVGLFATAFVIKLIAPRTYTYITTGNKKYYDSAAEYAFVGILIFLFWPFILIGLTLALMVKVLFKNALKNLFAGIYKMMPTIKFEK